MAKRKSLKNEASDYLRQVAGTGILLLGTSALIDIFTDVSVNYWLPVITAPMIPVLYRVLDNHKMAPRPSISVGTTFQSQKRGLFASTVRWSNTGTYNSRRGNDGYVSRKIRYDTPTPTQLFWDVQLSNRLQPIRIFEDDLHRFVNQASRRQRSNLPTFSRNYFARQFGEPEYNAMMQILWYCQLIYNRGQGTSGKLTVLTPYAVMWQVKNTYTALFD